MAAYRSIALKALAAFIRLKSGLHLAESKIMSPVDGDTNFRCWGTMDR